MSKETEKGRVYPVHEITGEGPETIHGDNLLGLRIVTIVTRPEANITRYGIHTAQRQLFQW